MGRNRVESCDKKLFLQSNVFVNLGKGPLSILAIFIVKMAKFEVEYLDASFKLASSCAKIIEYRIA
jgi:hypothetical protein